MTSPGGTGGAAPPLLGLAEQALGVRLTPLRGGYSGETFGVEIGPGERAVVRLCARDPGRAPVLAGLHRLVSGLLPVPRVLDARLTPPPGMPPFLLFEHLPGVRLDEVLPRADDRTRTRLGVAVAEVAVLLAGIPFAAGGTFEGLDLRVRSFPAENGTVAMAGSLLAGPFGGTLGPAEHRTLLRVAEEAADLVAAPGRTALVHSDFNPKNLLVDPELGTVTGLVDWEYSHAGSPVTDAGNLLRFGDHPVFDAAFASHFFAHAPALPPEPLRLARALDLIALLDLAARDVTGPNPITRRAAGLVADTARAGTLEAGRGNPG